MKLEALGPRLPVPGPLEGRGASDSDTEVSSPTPNARFQVQCLKPVTVEDLLGWGAVCRANLQSRQGAGRRHGDARREPFKFLRVARSESAARGRSCSDSACCVKPGPRTALRPGSLRPRVRDGWAKRADAGFQNYILICRDYSRQRQGRSFWGINACMRVTRRVLSPEKGTTFISREIVASRMRHPVSYV